MVARGTPKPSQKDTLKRIVSEIRNNNTVGHGIKYAGEGEGTLYRTSDTSMLLWDGPTAMSWRNDMDYAALEIETAKSTLEKTAQDLADAGARIDETNVRLGESDARSADAAELAATVSRELDTVDTRLTTTAGELSTLNTTVGGFADTIAASEQKASDALAKSVQAQASADGKNRITRSTSPASGAGTAVGDTHFVMSSMGGGATVTRQQRWDGSTWQDETVSHEVIASLDLGKATVGELDGGRIRANTVTADRLLVGLGDNYAPDPYFQAPQAWNVPLWVDPTASGYRTLGALVVPAGTSQRGAYMATRGNLPASRRVRFSVWVSSPTSLQVGQVRIFMRVYKPDGSWVFGVPTFVDNAKFIAADTWGQVTGEFVAPEDGATFMVGLFAQAAATNVVKFSEMQVIGQTQGELIVNGSILGEKVNAESVAAKVGQFVKVQAVNVEVTGDLATRVVNSMTANTKNLVVTGSAVIQHATLLGTTVADELNVRRLISGRDAILTGTVDIAQLNVTGTMAAEIANAMTVTTKKLVVTESAVMQHLTALEGIVTSELISQKASVEDLAAKMLTGGHIQTSTASNRGVKLDNSGIRAWDSAGAQTVNINGSSNYMMGRFSTAASGQRVTMSTSGSIAALDLYASRSTDDHMAMWYDSPDTNVLNSVARVLAISGTSYTRDSPGMEMWPMRGTFGFKGRWQQETDATKFVELTNSTGIKAGEWAQITVPYQTPFPTNNSLRLPMVSVERLYGADVIVNIVSESASSITVLVVNKSTSGSSGPIKVRAAIFNLNS